MAKEKLDASVKSQCHARGGSLIKYFDKAKTTTDPRIQYAVSGCIEVKFFFTPGQKTCTELMKKVIFLLDYQLVRPSSDAELFVSLT